MRSADCASSAKEKHVPNEERSRKDLASNGSKLQRFHPGSFSTDERRGSDAAARDRETCRPVIGGIPDAETVARPNECDAKLRALTEPDGKSPSSD
jgi:hypothetical protein